ncbi:alpha/beta fold hydrolase [Hoyosella subflava]|uniref:Putative hydrolase n=1 Tax=Hoyosella subflava (strain DSM 45089 / JCM 17490 / NBRC 109087 / DQS3-9A1) TaxID=443218 RepID=F6EQI8_HOYSD|nr:alpha/beta fold hydrolase [Hoyosella subflava]AEF40673.1 Putative hydrolase [Hoyosella subflava DQS3-9A1]
MTTLTYTRCGEGDPLVLIHGTGGRLGVWDPIAPALANHFDVIAIDLPGCGGTPALSNPSIQSLTDSVAEFIAELGVDAHIAGNSIGGSIALELGRRGLARSVTAFSPAGFWSFPGDVWFQAAMRSLHALGAALRPGLPALLRAVPTRSLLFGLVIGRPGQLDPRVALDDAEAVLDTVGFSTLMTSLRGYRQHPQYVADRIPVTIAWGSRDRLLIYRPQSRRAQRQLPHAQHVVLDKCGHIPFNDDPARCAAPILNQLVSSETSSPLAKKD